MKAYRFDWHGRNAPVYSCSEPEDQSGDYLRKDQTLNAIIAALQSRSNSNLRPVIDSLVEAFDFNFYEFLDMPACEYCQDIKKLEMDNNGPIVDCPVCSRGERAGPLEGVA